MERISDIIHHVEKITGRLNGDEGIQEWEGNREIGGVTVSWMASPDAIQAAGRSGHELLIVHESLYYPYNVINSGDPPTHEERS